MNKPTLKTLPILGLAALLAWAGSACAGASPSPVDTPAPMTQIVIREVTEEVTQQVTKIVQVPVTTTPEPTLTSTATLDPNATPTSSLPLAVLPEGTDCLYGPASFFTYKTSFPAEAQVQVVGRSGDSNWIAIEAVGGWDSCWIASTQAQLQSSRLEDLPVATFLLPRNEYEFGSPQTTSAKRDGDQVTVSWEAIYMSVDEVKGYLIEANLCKGGQLMNQLIFVPVTYSENTGTLSTTITDEAGCSDPSTAHIVTMGKRGFAEWEKIFWPPHP